LKPTTLPSQLEHLHKVCHELRRPLAVIQAYSDLLVDGLAGPLSEDQTEYVETLSVAADELGLQINSMLAQAEMQAGQFHVVERSTDVARVLEDLSEKMFPQFRRAQINWTTDLEPVTSETDPERLSLAFVQVLSNAVRHTPKEGYATMRLTSYGDSFRITVWNSGPSLPSHELTKVFEPFVRSESEEAPANVQGFGVGLAISKANTTVLGGKVWAEPGEE